MMHKLSKPRLGKKDMSSCEDELHRLLHSAIMHTCTIKLHLVYYGVYCASQVLMFARPTDQIESDVILYAIRASEWDKGEQDVLIEDQISRFEW